MGVKAARMQRTRTRATVARLNKQIEERDAKDPARIARGQRISSAKRDARRALRVLDSAQRAGRAAEMAAGGAVRRLLDDGMSSCDAAVLLGLPTTAVKRLLRLAVDATDPGTCSASTAPADNHAPGGVVAHGEASGTSGTVPAATNGGIL